MDINKMCSYINIVSPLENWNNWPAYIYIYYQSSLKHSKKSEGGWMCVNSISDTRAGS